MIVFATSDKGGTGRTVTGCNILYRLALQGADVAYVDFDFGSPTSGAIFDIDDLARGTASKKGLHRYFSGEASEPEVANIWSMSNRHILRRRPPGAGRMVLLPGDLGGSEFTVDRGMTERCAQLFLRLEEEYDISIVDLSAGRSYALQMALAVTSPPRPATETSRWLVFHRWTHQHITAAHGLVYGTEGILDAGVKVGHNREALLNQIRFVRTAVIDPEVSDLTGLRTAQVSWLSERNAELRDLASRLDLGASNRLGSVPLDPLLQWHEQLLTDRDQFYRQVANSETVQAIEELAERLQGTGAWEQV